MNKKLLIVNKGQFGYHTDTYFYCRYLKSTYDICYVCIDGGKEKLFEEGIKVVYVPSNGNYFIRALKFFKAILKLISEQNGGSIFIVYFMSVSILAPFLNRSNTIVDIRSGSVTLSNYKNSWRNWIMRNEVKFFRNISVISKGLAIKLRIKKKVHILPLGAIEISEKTKIYDRIRLLYVGTFVTRKIEVTIDAIARFVQEVNSNISYTIIGAGSKNDEEIIRRRIIDNNLSHIVKFEGEVKVNKLQKYFDSSNVGVTFIPITDYYNHQPPTKLFEYAMSGLVNIATATSINREFITLDNGVICYDNVEGFFKGLCEVSDNLNSYNYKKIKDSVSEYNWKIIVNNNLNPYLESVFNI